jgi:hypothetical protein
MRSSSKLEGLAVLGGPFVKMLTTDVQSERAAMVAEGWNMAQRMADESEKVGRMSTKALISLLEHCKCVGE